MRRAVAACTSPEVFFNRREQASHRNVAPGGMEWDPVGIAMDSAMDSVNLEMASQY